ncbi:putative ATP-dependent helicase YprA [Dichanthelium oligosanthes]|uniref:Putative ATP-dependent helicase YprA n=1 Tax=Dichanthelium oligosanthes TaxID=888268 RepID=A0A1E5UXW1_9POAL|nr:putative ATP-dependent helicase YprA [Dichanthelium oligosanthes]
MMESHRDLARDSRAPVPILVGDNGGQRPASGVAPSARARRPHHDRPPPDRVLRAGPQGRVQQPTRNALKAIGATRLYSHQAEAIESAAVSGNHVVVSTSTSSGKSLCYNVPVLESISRPASTSCALYIFPTKALAQDQLQTLLQMKGQCSNFDVSIYDGDTPMKDRAKIRDSARLLITNPDMLHMSILPCHAQFTRILSNLAYVVIDEAHSYKGAFGCHTALILRRLKRVCADIYGSHPKFIFCTTTLANPREDVMELAKLDGVELLQNDGSPCGSKFFLLWNRTG